MITNTIILSNTHTPPVEESVDVLIDLMSGIEEVYQTVLKSPYADNKRESICILLSNAKLKVGLAIDELQDLL